jgi:hypothetical protein
MKEYPYEALASHGICFDITNWVSLHCVGKYIWAYVYPGKGGLMRFELEEDAIVFALKWR